LESSQQAAFDYPFIMTTTAVEQGRRRMDVAMLDA